MEIVDMFENDPVAYALKRIGGKWKPHVLYGIYHDIPMRFSKALNNIPISERMLAQTLRELEADGLIKRKVYPEMPPRVEYFLAEPGKRAIPVLEALYGWGRETMMGNGMAPDPVGELHHGYVKPYVPEAASPQVGCALRAE